jgi:hypothetical protein
LALVDEGVARMEPLAECGAFVAPIHRT